MYQQLIISFHNELSIVLFFTSSMFLLQKFLAFTPRTGNFHSLWLNLFKNIAWEELHVSIVVDADVGL